ncbi:50S ribosomal protein L22 [Patescibacteria group bacterium]|nr:50S ribosomal protein L22 [Patescibacteria group bacterium]MBU0776796.1 50S ribosomal protein L22 [Patescibacteria group bacterium]MBU0845629.1 50S ribosomal protein L22 [Patescibacteria group bacterium]MBU0922671.1 50S ribosomal protein L22 [Patescibacteria group bacterium]MBU1066722.1 50S ribosomal protein L22 [Patescibacteria group bacterium]
MEIKSVQKFVKTSPRKLRLVADLAKKMTPAEAIEALPFSRKYAAEPLVKVIKTAMANAKVKGVKEGDLIFKEIQINEGPRLKRGRAASRGMWHPYKRRMSHIRVVLEEKKGKEKALKPKTKVKKEEKPTKKETKKKGEKAK